MKKEKIIFFIILTATFSLALAYLYLWPIYGQYFPKCIFHELTGFYCPGCGSQRAIAALMELNFADALHNNLLILMAIPFLIFAFVTFFFKAFFQKNISQKLFYKPAFTKTVLVMVILFFILRNIPLFPFQLLAPI